MQAEQQAEAAKAGNAKFPAGSIAYLATARFFDDVLSLLPVGGLRADLRTRVAAKLQRRIVEVTA